MIITNVDKIAESSKKEVESVCDVCGVKYFVPYRTYVCRHEQLKIDLCDNCHEKERLNQIRDNHYPRILKFCQEHGYNLLTQREEIFNNQSSITYICPLHGEQTTKVTNILQGKQCYKCSRKIAGITKWEHGKEQRETTLYEKVLAECSKSGYVLLDIDSSDYKYDHFFNYSCPTHGKQQMKIGNFLAGKRCPECARDKLSEKFRKSPEQVEAEVIELGGRIYNPSDYINQYKKNLQIACPLCGHEFITSLVLFTLHGGLPCPECSNNESYGARRIRKYLEDNNIEYDPEHWFPDCRDVRPLPFDFYLIGRKTIIEYDGSQHYAKDRPEYTKIHGHDEIKNKYCEDNGIKLIRIPYWKLNKIEDILDKELT